MTPYYRSVCVVDDDSIYQFTTARMLQLVDENMQVLSFGDGEKAMRYLEEHADQVASLPDVILLDLNMPLMDGWEFLDVYNSLKARLAKDIPIFVISSSIDQRDIRRARSFGSVNDYVPKPVTTDRLRELLCRSSFRND